MRSARRRFASASRFQNSGVSLVFLFFFIVTSQQIESFVQLLVESHQRDHDSPSVRTVIRREHRNEVRRASNDQQDASRAMASSAQAGSTQSTRRAWSCTSK